MIFMALVGLGGCATHTDGPPPSSVARAYGLYHFEGLAERDGLPAVPATEWTATQFLDLQELDSSCHRQMDPQIPSIVKEVFLPSGRMTLAGATGGAIGTGLGAVNAFTGVSFADYAKYAFGATIGQILPTSAIGYAERYSVGKRYVQYACMVYATNQASASGRLVGVGVILNPFLHDMNGVAAPTGTSAGPQSPAPGRSTAPVTPPGS
jgi:hypothetical protein